MSFSEREICHWCSCQYSVLPLYLFFTLYSRYWCKWKGVMAHSQGWCSLCIVSPPNGWEGLQQDHVWSHCSGRTHPTRPFGIFKVIICYQRGSQSPFYGSEWTPLRCYRSLFSDRPSLCNALSDKCRGRRVSSLWMQVVAQLILVLTNGIHKKRGTVKFLFLNVHGFSFPVSLSNALDSRSLSWLDFCHC